MEPPRLLERDDHLRALIDAAVAARSGAGSVALVSGEAGIGKTSLLAAFAADQATTTRVLIGGCDDLAVPRPLGPFLDMADRLPALDALLTAPGTDAARVIFEVLRGDDATICVVEDAHWADEATLDVLTFLARRIERIPVLLVISFRDDEVGYEHPLRRALAAVSTARAHRIELPRLSLDAVRTLASPHVDAAQTYAITAGNPFFVAEVLSSGTDGTPASVRDSILARMAGLSSSARAVAQLVSVVPGRAEIALLEARLPDFNLGLADADARGLLILEGAAARFRHELARRAVEESLSEVERRDLNRAVLEYLVHADASAARRAHHAWQAGDVGALIRNGRDAAVNAAAAGSHREAAEHLARVLEHAGTLDADERAGLLEDLSEQAYHANQPERAVPAREQALEIRRESGDPLALGTTLRWLSRLRWWTGDGVAADVAAGEAVEVLETIPPTRELAMALSTRSQLAMLAQRDDVALRWGNQAIALAKELGDTETFVHAQTNVATVIGYSDAAARGFTLLAEAADLAIEAGLDEHACRAMTNLGWAATEMREYVCAREAIGRGLAYARERELDLYVEYFIASLARLDLATGDWDVAARAARDLVDQPRLENTVARIPALEVLGLVELRRGQPEAAAHLDAAWQGARASEELQRLRPIACARAEAAWISGDLAAVDAATRDTYELALQVGHRWDVGELAVWRWRAGVLATAPEASAAVYACEIRGDATGAAAQWAQIGAPYSQALALMASDEPADLLEAVGLFDRLGATAVAPLTRARLRRLGVTSVPRGPRAATRTNPAGLTSRQMEVLGLIVEGLSNAEIARRLVVTPKTVEHHVAAVLAKLGAENRRDAARTAVDIGVIVGGQVRGPEPPT